MSYTELGSLSFITCIYWDR